MVRPVLKTLQVLPALESGGVERGTIELTRGLRAAGHRVLAVSAGGRLLPSLLDAGAAHLDLPVGKKSFRVLPCVRQLREVLLREAVDVIDVHSRLPAWIVWRALQGMRPARRPALVTTLHGFYHHPRYSRVMCRGDRVIAVSRALADYAAELCQADTGLNCTVIPRGVDPGRYYHGFVADPGWQEKWYTQFPATRHRFLVTLPARITRWKGQLDFIPVIAGLKAQGIPVHGLMVGDQRADKAGFAETIDREIRLAGIGEHVTLCGHRRDLREILSISDAVVSLSQDPEAFGRASLEALALGRPVCGYDHGGVSEQLAGLFPAGRVPVGDVDAVIACLSAWYRNPPGLGCVNPYTLDAMIDKTMGVYSELAAESCVRV